MTTRASDSQQLVRQWALLRLLTGSARWFTVRELAEQLQVSKATIERDLATLEKDFALIERSEGKQKKSYRIDQQIQALEGLRFGVMELFAVYAAHGMLSSFRGVPMYEDLGDVARKIRGLLGPRHNGGVDALCRVVMPHVRAHVDYAPQRDQIDVLVDAIARHRVCNATYHAAWKGTTRKHRVRPLRLLSHQSSLYLLACLGSRDEIATLAVHRIRDLDLTEETFKPPRLDLDAYIGKAFRIFVGDQEEDVEIRFDAEIAWQVEERTFHPAEEKQRNADGSLTYRVRTGAQWEIVPWVRSYGALAELIAPGSWRETVRTSAEAVLARYAPTSRCGLDEEG